MYQLSILLFSGTSIFFTFLWFLKFLLATTFVFLSGRKGPHVFMFISDLPGTEDKPPMKRVTLSNDKSIKIIYSNLNDEFEEKSR